MIQNRLTATIFRGASFLFALIGLLEQMGIFRGKFSLASFMYYTIQSNLLAFIMFGILLVRTIKGLKEDGIHGRAGYFTRFEMVCTVDLLLTFIVYWVLLAPRSFSMNGGFNLWTFGNLAVHMITPLLCLVDYILFAETGRIKYRDVYAILIYPLSYVLLTTIAGYSGYVYNISIVDGKPVRFPYFFFDYDRIGSGAFTYIVVLVLLFLVISHMLYFIDRRWARHLEKK